MTNAINIRTKKFLERRNTICEIDAPSVFRIPTSLIFLEIMIDDRPNNQILDISMSYIDIMITSALN